MAFDHVVTVRFQHVDRAGIAFFSRAFEYCHETFEELLAAAGLASVFEVEGWGMPLVHADADFRAPMRLGDRLSVAVVVADLGERSITFRFEIKGAEDGRVRATVCHVHAFVELGGFRPRQVPDSVRHGLARVGLIEPAADLGG